MRNLLIVLALGATIAAPSAQTPAKSPKADAHVILTPGDLKWGPAPPVLPPGAQIAVLDGDPTKPGFFSIRLKFPDGYKVPPHWHPTDENIVVVQGTFRAGMGDVLADAQLHEFAVGSFIKMPKKMHHFAAAKGETIVQIYGDGPFVVNYLNASDDPTRKPTR